MKELSLQTAFYILRLLAFVGFKDISLVSLDEGHVDFLGEMERKGYVHTRSVFAKEDVCYWFLANETADVLVKRIKYPEVLASGRMSKREFEYLDEQLELRGLAKDILDGKI